MRLARTDELVQPFRIDACIVVQDHDVREVIHAAGRYARPRLESDGHRSTEAAIPNVGMGRRCCPLDWSPPPRVPSVPFDRLAQALLESFLRCPAETPLRLRPVDRVSSDVAGPVCDPLDHRLRLAA